MKLAKLLSKGILLFILVFGLSVVINSCKSDGCMDNTALNYDSEAGKDDGSCIYPSDKLVGSWSAVDSVGSGGIGYNVTITKSTNENIKISAVRPTTPDYFYNDLILTVNWLELKVSSGDSITGTIVNENDFHIEYMFGQVGSAYKVKVYYTR
ncbi:MAG: hypothetical protein K9J13_06275 [Saprospiraceae bacterium]|nr:hypothetical protein [Saprospiraceae bacterium]